MVVPSCGLHPERIELRAKVPVRHQLSVLYPDPMPNRLAQETSPYLLQHKDNPVDWYPWGDEAFETARARDVPILLSIGYSTCHWCHVMEHESFEDEATAALMNAHFVPVKVDREERPDVDLIYMEAVTALTGRGGWPMTVFVTPDARPFYAGTYFPPTDRQGMPGFQTVLIAIHDAWNSKRDEVTQQAATLTEAIGQRLPAAAEPPTGSAVAQAYHTIVGHFDREYGGIGGAPKFPQEPVLEFLTRIHDAPWATEARALLDTTLTRMATGGIYDHLGGGFSRYAVDRVWLVPHFEKMLYNNAELARLYVRAWQITGDARYRTVATETLDYVLRDLTHVEGGFFAAEDADSEGVEGKFYVFGYDEFRSIVGEDDADLTAGYFGVSPGGNFEGLNIVHEARSPESVADELDRDVSEIQNAISRAKQHLFAHRSTRIRPGLDTKVIAAWNGLTLRALAVAGSAFRDDRYLDAARRNAEFVLSNMTASEGRLYRTWSDGTGSILGYLEDHAAYALGLLELYQVTGEATWFAAARTLIDALVPQFGGPDGVVFASAADASNLIVRPTNQQDNPIASGASLAAECFQLMSLFTGDHSYRDEYDKIVRASAPLIDEAPTAVGHLLALSATDRMGFREVALTGPDALDWSARLAETYRPNVVIAATTEPNDDIPLLKGRFRDSGTWAYVCRDMVCDAPVDSYEALISLL